MRSIRDSTHEANIAHVASNSPYSIAARSRSNSIVSSISTAGIQIGYPNTFPTTALASGGGETNLLPTYCEILQRKLFVA